MAPFFFLAVEKGFNRSVIHKGKTITVELLKTEPEKKRMGKNSDQIEITQLVKIVTLKMVDWKKK